MTSFWLCVHSLECRNSRGRGKISLAQCDQSPRSQSPRVQPVTTSTWLVWGNKSTRCTAPRANPASVSSLASRPIEPASHDTRTTARAPVARIFCTPLAFKPTRGGSATTTSASVGVHRSTGSWTTVQRSSSRFTSASSLAESEDSTSVTRSNRSPIVPENNPTPP